MPIVKKSGRPPKLKDIQKNDYPFNFVINKDKFARLKNIAEKEHRTVAMQLRLIVDNFIDNYDKEKIQ